MIANLMNIKFRLSDRLVTAVLIKYLYRMVLNGGGQNFGELETLRI